MRRIKKTQNFNVTDKCVKRNSNENKTKQKKNQEFL